MSVVTSDHARPGRTVDHQRLTISRRKPDGMPVTRAGGVKVPVVDRSVAADVAAVLASANADFAARPAALPPGDAGAQDLAASVAEFTAAFGAG